MKKFLGFIKKHKKAIIIIAILIIVVFGVFKIVKAVKNAQNLLTGMQSSASTEEVESRDIVNSVTATGTIVAADTRTISSTVTGVKVKELKVQVGDQVQAGEILCVLDGENFEQQLADANTMLNADAGRSSLDVQSSQRGLNEAITSRDIGTQRAEEDKQTAYRHVEDAANECQESKDKYDAAADKTRKAKSDMEDAKKALEDAKNAGLADTSAIIAEANTKLTEATDDYKTTADNLDAYVSSITASDIAAGYSKQMLYDNLGSIGNVVVSDIYTGSDEGTRTGVDSRLGELKTKEQAVSQAKNNLDSAATAAANAKAYNIQVAEAAYEQAKLYYESMLAQEESQKSVYEAKAKTVESMWESFNNVVRGADDSKRANDSAVASRLDGVKNSNITASTATLADKRNITQLQEQIDSCVITASIGGTVTDISVKQGENYLGGAILTIENTQDYEISAQIDEYDIARVKLGQEVIVKTNGTGTTEMKGEVKFIAPHATTTPGVSGVKYEVKISLLDRNPDLKLDMTAKIEIINEKREGVLSVASEAIQEDDDGKFFVEVLDSGTPIDTSAMLSNPEDIDEEEMEKLQSGEKSYESHNVYVEKGIVGDYYTEIISDEIEAGTKIVIPNDGAFSDIEEYMEQAGMAGGF